MKSLGTGFWKIGDGYGGFLPGGKRDGRRGKDGKVGSGEDGRGVGTYIAGIKSRDMLWTIRK